MKFSILIAVTGLLCSACTMTNVQRYSEIDEDEKTITVPAGAGGLKGDVKRALVDDGWKLSIYKGPVVTKGKQGKSTHLRSYDTYNTRYVVHMETRVLDYCFNFEPAIKYDISLIDNESGMEVITMNGHGCEDAVADAFIEALSGKGDK